MTDARVSNVNVEVLAEGEADARLTQVNLEALVSLDRDFPPSSENAKPVVIVVS